LKVKEGEYYLVTIHRPSNVDDSASLGSLYEELKDIKTPIVFPCHPRTQKRMEENSLWEEVNNSWIVTPPIPYLEFHALLQKSKGVITDSGGIQKEAYFYKVPCFTLRPETEWIETVDAGWNTVVRPGVDSLRTAIDNWIEPKFHKPLYGDGRAAAKMVKALWSFEVNKTFDGTQ
jgi:UDP-N-acetylglucosamine 2-epimerase